MKLSFNTNGNPKQLQACEAWADKDVFEIYYGGAKYGGKSFLGCNLIFSDALTYPGTHYFIARKDLSDLVKHTIPSINEVFEIWDLSNRYYNYNGQDNVYHLYNGSRVYLLYAKYLPSDPLYERFGSMQMTRGWIEEGGEFVEDAYRNLKISIGRWKNELYDLAPKLLTTCNPKKNYIYRNVYKPYKQDKLLADTVFIQALPHDNKTASKDYINNLERTLKGSARQRLLLGNWEYDDDPTAMIGFEHIETLWLNDHVKGKDVYIVSDIARFGSDKAIVAVWLGYVILEYHKFDISKTTDIQNCINAMRIKYAVSVNNTVADEDGIGGGVVDNCQIRGFVNNSKAPNPTYQNLKTECGYKLAEIMNQDKFYIKCEMPDAEKQIITEDLEQLKTYDSDKENKLRILPKAKIKENIGRSPDWLDIFIMRMFFDIVVRKEAKSW